MDLPGHRLSTAVEEPLHNPLKGQQRLTVQNMDSLFDLVIGFKSWDQGFSGRMEPVPRQRNCCRPEAGRL